MLPLPPPPDEDALPTRQRSRRPPTKELTAEMPRLPEVGLHEESSEVRVDHRALSPGRSSLSGARSMPV